MALEEEQQQGVDEESGAEDLSNSWQMLQNRAKRDLSATEDMRAAAQIEIQEREAALAEAAKVDAGFFKETGKAVWGATVDVTSETFIMAKDLSRAILPLDGAMAGFAKVAEGGNFFEGVAEQNALNESFNDDMRRRADEIAPANETLVGGLSRGALTFMVPYVGISKALKGVDTVADAAALGFVLDTTLFDPNEGNLSALIKELSPETQSVVLDFLATDPDDSEALNRLRNGLEGGVIGIALEGIFRTARFVLSRKKVEADYEVADEVLHEYDMEVAPFESTIKVDEADDSILIFRDRPPREEGVEIDVQLGPDEAGKIEAVPRGGETLQIINAAVEPDLRGTGAGRELYDRMIAKADEMGLRLTSDTSVSESAAGVWERLARDGHEIIDQRTTNPDNIEIVNGQIQTKNGTPVFERVRGPEVDVDAPTPGRVEPELEEGAKVVDEIDLASDLRSTLQLTKAEKEAYIKALESDDPTAVDQVFNAFNERTINWAAMENPEDIKQILQVTAEVFAEHIDKVGGGVQSNVATKRLANLVGNTGEQVHELFKDLTTDKGITARMHAAERTMLSSARHLYQLRAKVKAAPENLQLKADFMRHLQLHAALQAEVKGAKREIARALQGMQILKDEASSGFKEFDDVLRQMGGEQSNAADFGRFMDDLLDGRSLEELNAKIRQTAGQRFKNVIVEFVINSMLSSLKTHAINVTSNTLNTFLYTADRFIGGSYRYITGDKRLLREARYDLFGKFQSLSEAWELSKQAWADGAPVTDKRQRLEFQTRRAIAAEGTQSAIRQGDENLHEVGSTFFTRKREVVRDKAGEVIDAVEFNWLQRAVNTLGNFVRVPGRALITGDEFFKAVNRNAEIRVLAFRKADELAEKAGHEYGTEAYEKFVNSRMKKLMDPDSNSPAARDIRSRAIEKSRLTTFQEAPRTKGGTNMERAINGNAFVKLVIAPFFRTPMNILRQGALDRTFLGLAMREHRAALRTASPNVRAEIIARMTTGTAAMAMAYQAIDAGGEDMPFEVIGKVPWDSTAKVNGVQDYSIRIGDTWYQFNRLDPLGMWLGMVADMNMAVKHHDATNPDDDERVFALAQGAMSGFMNNVANKTWMRSMADLIETIEGFRTGSPETVQRSWARFTSGQIGKFIPQIVKSTGSALEGERTAREAWTVLDGLAAQVPILNKDVPVRHDVLGRPMTREMSGWAVINPFATSPDSDDPVEREFARLAFDVKPMPRSLGGGSLPLNAEEYSKLTGMVGDTKLYERLERIITAPDWDSKTPQRKIKEIKIHMEAARREARLRFINLPEMKERFKEAVKTDLQDLLTPQL